MENVMYKISEIVSTPIISIYESSNQGIVYNLLFEPKTKKCKLISILNEDDGIKKILKISDIYKFGAECIFVKNANKLELECDYEKDILNLVNPINLIVYNMEGKKIGYCVDAIISKSFSIESIILSDNQVIDIDKIINIGKSIILVNDKKIKISNFKPTNKIHTKNIQNNKVIILSDKDETEQISTINSNKITTINKIITDYRFLIGRILSKDILAINGELIAKNGTTVTKDVISRASLYGKLVEIARYSNKKA